MKLDAGGAVGANEAGFGRRRLVIAGSGRASGGVGRRVLLAQGLGRLIRARRHARPRHEMHARRPGLGWRALFVQVDDLVLDHHGAAQPHASATTRDSRSRPAR
jgi:hypothetical protein